MQKFKKAFFIVLVIVFLSFFSNSANALSTGYQNIHEGNLFLNDDSSMLQFTNVNFKNFSQAFGLSGIVYNGNPYDVTSMNTNNSGNVPSKNIAYKSYEYVIDRYHIDIIVHENNTFDITESITAYFHIPKHGIFRTIPLTNSITRLGGPSSKNRVQISNVSVDHKYTTSKENGNLKLQIGSADRTLTGEQNYVIQYTYNIGKDPLKDADELYYNIIGTDWDTVIGNVTFSITMPKEFDASKLGFSSGARGSVHNSKVKYEVNGNKITGSYDGILGVGEALTVRCELPEGYFVDAGFSLSILDYILYFAPIFFLGISVFLWYKFGRDDLVVETVEFYPPDGLNSLDAGFLYKGVAVNKDVTSLLLILANKGYIEIANDKIDLNSKKVSLDEDAKHKANQKIMELQRQITEERKINPNSKKIKYYENMLEIYQKIDEPIDYEQYGLKSFLHKPNKKNKFILKKLKDYDGEDIHEQWFMEGLFEYDRTEVTDDMLYNHFYITNNSILQNINRKQNVAKIFETSSLNKKKFIVFMILATICFITIPPFLNSGEPFVSLLIAILFPGFGFLFMYFMLFDKNQGIYGNVNSPFSTILFVLFWVVGFGGMPSLFLVLPLLLQSPIYWMGYLIGLVCLLGMILCIKYMPKRTKYGNEMLGKLKGFKNFLETVEKDRLEALVLEKPSYFYDILPYTYVLGVSNKWIKKFESMSLQAPSWYCSDSFDFSTFEIFVNSTMNSAQRAMSSSPSDTSSSDPFGDSGSSSGGGSSGGGSGGGGGGSW